MDRRRRNPQGIPHNHQDRLSNLPEELIILILSLLVTKDAVKTGILSKRWKNLWTRLDNLVFVYPDTDWVDESMSFWVDGNMSFEQMGIARIIKHQQFLSFVDCTLMRCTGPKIKTFSFDYVNVMLFHTNRDFLYANFQKWMAHVLEKKVEFLALRFGDYLKYVPDCLYMSSTLTNLELDRVQLDKSSLVNWSSLNSLSLMNMFIDDPCIDNILAGCPVLETIALRSVYGMSHVNIMSSSVKKLELVDFCQCDEWTDGILNIRAPWIQEIEIEKRFLGKKCKLVDVSSLVKATLNFTSLFGRIDCSNKEKILRYNRKWIPMVAELLQSVSHVDQLVIGSDSIQVLSLSKLRGGPSPLFRKCKHVSITSRMWKFDLPGIVCLLENSPHLETLLIKVVRWKEEDVPLPQVRELYEELYEYKQQELCSRYMNFLHLKTVKIDYLQENVYIECGSLAIATYILQRAVVLRKLVLFSSSGSSFCRPRIVKSSELLSTFLTRNIVAEWELKQINGRFEFSFPKSI